MSNEESTYTELELCTKPAESDIHTLSSSEPISRGNGTLEAAKALQEKQGCWIKFLVSATIVNFLVIVVISATVVYLLQAQAGKPSDDLNSILQGSDSTAAPGLSGDQGMQDLISLYYKRDTKIFYCV